MSFFHLISRIIHRILVSWGIMLDRQTPTKERTMPDTQPQPPVCPLCYRTHETKSGMPDSGAWFTRPSEEYMQRCEAYYTCPQCREDTYIWAMGTDGTPFVFGNHPLDLVPPTPDDVIIHANYWVLGAILKAQDYVA